jgi:hypothetical protein
MDLIVSGEVIVEIKAVETLLKVHEAQLLTYMKLSEISVGLLLNFNVVMMRDGIKRFVREMIILSPYPCTPCSPCSPCSPCRSFD